ncbi:hypothetical protein CEXT_808431, partial [Caerostris extrusa]
MSLGKVPGVPNFYVEPPGNVTWWSEVGKYIDPRHFCTVEPGKLSVVIMVKFIVQEEG